MVVQGTPSAVRPVAVDALEVIMHRRAVVLTKREVGVKRQIVLMAVAVTGCFLMIEALRNRVKDLVACRTSWVFVLCVMTNRVRVDKTAVADRTVGWLLDGQYDGGCDVDQRWILGLRDWC